jgi:hypothetical protein
MHKSLTLVILVLTASALVVSTFALVTIQRNIPGSGSIKGVGVEVYMDSACNNPLSSIDFGLLEAGSQKEVTFYLRNEGNADLTLSMTSKDWNPIEAADYLSLVWNREGQQMRPGQVISCLMTLSVSSSIQGINSYDLTITITATG